MGLNVNLFIKKNVLFIRTKGEMDQETCIDLRMKLTEVIVKYEIMHVVFNFKDLTFMDSSGIGVIIGRYNQLKQKGGKVFLCELSEVMKKIVVLSGLPKICLIKENEDVVNYYLEELC